MNNGFPSTDELNAKTGRTAKAAALGTPSLRRRHAPAPPRTGRAKPASELRGRMAHLLCTEPTPAVFTSAQGVAFALVGFAPAREGPDAECEAARTPSPHPEGPPPSSRADDTFEPAPDSPRRLRAHNARLEARIAEQSRELEVSRKALDAARVSVESVSAREREAAHAAELSTRERDELSALVAGELRAPLRDLVKRARRLREEQDPVALRKALRALERRARSLAETAEALSATAGRLRDLFRFPRALFVSEPRWESTRARSRRAAASAPWRARGRCAR